MCIRDRDLIWKKKLGSPSSVFFSPDNKYILLGGTLMTIDGEVKWSSGIRGFKEGYFDKERGFIIGIDLNNNLIKILS